MCDIFTQEGCLAGQGCYMATNLGGLVCLSAGLLDEGDACESGNDCKGGLLCVNGTCQPVCSQKPEHADEAYTCNGCGSPTTFNPAAWGIGACQDSGPAVVCDFWAQDCEDGKLCVPVTNGATCVNPNAAGLESDPCNGNSDCSPMLLCASGACKPACSINEFPDDPSTPICVDDCPNNAFQPIGGQGSQIGICTE
jgi:hypothetical protein